MAREKKNKIRKDKRYRRRYQGIDFYSYISDEDAKAKRDEYKRQEQMGFTKKASVAEYGLPWLKRTYPNIANSTKAGLAVHLQHLVDEIGEKDLDEVVPSDIKDVYTNQYKNCSNSYLKSAKQLFSSLFDAAVADGYCPSNPARAKTAKPHKGTGPKTRPITAQEREWINTLCTDHRAFPAVMAMLYAGLRPQEAKALNIERDVDFERKVITLHEFAHKDPENMQKYAFTEVGKTDNAIRQIPLFPPLENALKGRKGYLITSAHGEQVTHTTWRVAWNSYKCCMERAINGMDKRWYGRTREHKRILAEAEALRKAGKRKEAEAKKGEIPKWIEFNILPYSLRHSYCCMLRDAGVEMNTARKWMGHSDAQMILKVYDSVSENRSESERQKVENRLFGGQIGGQKKNEDHESLEK